MAYVSSQARSHQIYSCQPVQQQCQIWAASATYTTPHGNAGSPTHWVRPGIEPLSSWMLVGFLSAAPQWELPPQFFSRDENFKGLLAWWLQIHSLMLLTSGYRGVHYIPKTYFTTVSRYLLTSLTRFTPPQLPPLCIHQSGLCTYDFRFLFCSMQVVVLFFLFIWKEWHRSFDRDCIDRTGILTKLIFSIHEYRYLLSFTCTVFTFFYYRLMVFSIQVFHLLG